MTQSVRLYRGEEALIDDEDHALASQYRWHADSHGYARHTKTGAEHGRVLFLHRLIVGAESGQSVDHIDGNPLNNKRANLRVCSHAENMQNRRPHANRRSQFKGLEYRPDYPLKPYGARIRVDGKRQFLGGFATEEEAARAYDRAAIANFGSFARLNFPRSGS